jgi:hypothetical protein
MGAGRGAASAAHLDESSAGVRCDGIPVANSTAASDRIVGAERAWAKAAVDGDATAMASFMSDDYIEIVLSPSTTTRFEAACTEGFSF